MWNLSQYTKVGKGDNHTCKWSCLTKVDNGNNKIHPLCPWRLKLNKRRGQKLNLLPPLLNLVRGDNSLILSVELNYNFNPVWSLLKYNCNTI